MRLIDLAALRVDGRPIAVARVLLAFALGLCALESGNVLRRIAETGLRYPLVEWIPEPTLGGGQAVVLFGLFAALFLLLGIASAASAAVGSAVLAIALLWDQQTYSNHQVLVALLLAYLSLAEPGRRWSVAALREHKGSTVRWWPQLLMLTQVTVLYLFAGLSKINPVFLSGVPLQGWLWPDLPIELYRALAVATIVTEIFLAIALWIPRVRVLAVMVGVGLHAGIVLGLGDPNLVLSAFAAASISSYWLFLSRPRLRPRIQAGSEAPVGDHPARQLRPY